MARRVAAGSDQASPTHLEPSTETRAFFAAEAATWEAEHGPGSVRHAGFARIVSLLRDEVRRIGSNAAVLDVGCATGAHLRTLSSEIRFGLGLDLSAEMIAEACARLEADAERPGNLTFLNLEIGDYAQAVRSGRAEGPERFDLVCFVGVLEHIPDRAAALAAAAGWLAPGGRVIVVAPHRHALPFLLHRLRHGGRPPRLCPTDRHFSVTGLNRMARGCGLAVERVVPIPAPPVHGATWPIRVLERVDRVRARIPGLRMLGTFAAVLARAEDANDPANPNPKQNPRA